MNDTIDDLGLEESELEIVQDPYSHDFRPEEPEVYSFELDESLFQEVEVDPANETVSVTYSGHDEPETYIHVHQGDNFSLVERQEQESTEVESYYLVTDDGDVLMNEGDGYEESPNVRPVQVAEASGYLFDQALEGEEGELELERERLEGR